MLFDQVRQGDLQARGRTPWSQFALAHGFSNGDEVFLAGITGTIQLDNQSFVVAGAATNTFSLLNTLDNAPVDTTSMGAYISGGTAARIYTFTIQADNGILPDPMQTFTLTIVPPTRERVE